MPVQVQRTTDVDVIRDLSIRTFTETFAASNTEQDMRDFLERDYNRDVLAEQINDPDSTFFLVTVDGTPAGYMKVNVGRAQTEKMGDDALEVQRIYILREFKRHGIGTLLMNTAMDQARQLGKTHIWLGVWEHNDAAQAFYRRFGFTRTGQHDFYVGDDRQTDYLMEKTLN